MKNKNPYPYCKKYGLKVVEGEIQDEQITKLFDRMGKPFVGQFNRLFGIQTSSASGLYACDVEAVLCRMDTGKRTGTQLLWD